MTRQEQLCKAVKQIAWGYVLLHLNINLGTLNILPDWLGYYWMLSSLPVLAKEEPSAALLRPLGLLLTAWAALLWLAALIGAVLPTEGMDLIITVVSLYFHFQLLTNLAAIARTYDCPQEERILRLRTVRTLLITLLFLPLPWEDTLPAAFAVILLHLIVAIWICSVLFSLRNSLAEQSS